MWRWLAFIAVAAATLAATVAVLAPAQWAALALRSATDDRVDLAETSGSLWRGRGTLVLTAGSDAAAARASLPEPLSWTLSPWALLTGTIDLTLSHPSALSQPLSLRLAPGRPAVLGATTLQLPASLLMGLGAPWNTLKPGGVLKVSWDRLQVAPGELHGQLGAEWQFASSSLTPVSPFGHYRLVTNGQYPGMTLQLQTLAGPLELSGTGTIDAGGRFRFDGLARPQPDADPLVKSQLLGLIALLGPRRGTDTATLRFGS